MSASIMGRARLYHRKPYFVWKFMWPPPKFRMTHLKHQVLQAEPNK